MNEKLKKITLNTLILLSKTQGEKVYRAILRKSGSDEVDLKCALNLDKHKQ